ncbi:MAG: ATP-binding protein, partial [Clostridia bacterium]|nr:ATP-binding protein [Clostridia bacterium]
ANLMFQLISTRYEKRSTIITTNVGIGGWANVFGDDVAASAIADRVCHHCTLIKITGRSYRLKDLPAERRKED